MTGVVNKVNIWLTSSPPTIVMPRGWRSSEPTPVPSIKGNAPSKAAMVVIKIGRRRSRQAWKIASRGGLPSRRSASSAKSIIMIAFFLTMPISRMMPMIEMIDRSVPETTRARSAPTPGEGGALKIDLRAGGHLQRGLLFLDGRHRVAQRRTRGEVERHRRGGELADV